MENGKISKCEISIIMKIKLLISFISLLLISQSSEAQSFAPQTPTAPNSTILDKTLVGTPYAKIRDLSWIEGNWKGKALGGQIEEIWSAPQGKSMMGMFRLVNEGEVSFYELIVIREINDSLVLQLKHFSKSLKGWEEKDNTIDFPLVKISKDKVWFEGYTFERTSENVMTVNVLIDEEKQPEGTNFIYHRQ